MASAPSDSAGPVAVCPEGFAQPPIPGSAAIKAGGWVFVSAQLPTDYSQAVAEDARSRSPYRRSAEELQSRYVMRRITQVLDAAGCDVSRDVMRIYWWLPSPFPTFDEFEEGILWPRIRTIDPFEWGRDKVIPSPQPASTGIGVRELLVPSARVATGAIAFEPRDGIEKHGFDVPASVPKIPDTPCVRCGDWIFMVGAVATDWKGDFMTSTRMGHESGLAPEARVNPYTWFGIPMEKQVDYTLAMIERIAEAAGTSLKRCVKATVHIGHPNDFFALDRAWQRWFPENPPARMIVPFSALGVRGCRVEIALKFLANDSPLEIQPIESSDAPEPFGHEPQAVKAGHFLFFSTQLAVNSEGELAPETVADPGFPYYTNEIKLQMRYIVSNVAAICEAAGTSIENICRRHAFYDDFECYLPMLEEWLPHFPKDPPASSDLKLGRGWPLLAPGCRVLMDLIAYVPD